MTLLLKIECGQKLIASRKLSSKLSFVLAGYCLVNRPTEPFHFFLAFMFFYLLFLPLSCL